MKKLELKERINVNLPKHEIKVRILNFFERNRIKIKEVKEKVITGLYGSRLQPQTRDIIADPSILPGKIFIDEQPTSNGTDLDVQMKVSYEKTPTVEKHACNYCDVIISDKNQNFCDLCGQEL